MYRDTLLTKGIKTQSKTAHQAAKLAAEDDDNFGPNRDLTLPPIDAHKQRPPRTMKKVSMSGTDGGARKRSTIGKKYSVGS